MKIRSQKSEIGNFAWLPDLDSNQDKQIQSLLCYRYTIGQAVAKNSLGVFRRQSRFVKPVNRYTVKPGIPIPQFNSLPIQRFNDSTNQRI